MSTPALVAAAHHTAPSAWLVVVLVALALLYVGWRTKRLRRLRGAAGVLRLRNELRGLRIRPLALLPTLVLLIVVLVLIFDR